jgi:glyoxylase-like metal-dependent hydrolase (beta-lactamase superfamily II)
MSEQDGHPTDITPLGDEVFAIDTRMAGFPGIVSAFLIRTERPCLIEVGTAGSAPVLRDALASLGVTAEELATVVVTHIHLDHAGGTGDIASLFPGAEIVVHERGARHLAAPERLIRSSRQVFGDKFDLLFGDMRPTEGERMRAVGQTARIDLGGGRSLQAHYTPGHAKHHIGLVDSATGDLYVGDAVGIYNQQTKDLKPATPPPDFDLEAALASLELFRDIAPRRLMFSHFGAVGGTEELLARSEEELRLWVETIRGVHSSRGDLDHAVALVREKVISRYRPLPEGVPEQARQALDLLAGPEANTKGIWHWLDKLEEAQRQEAAQQGPGDAGQG